MIKIVPISKFEYRVYPIYEEDSCIEISEEDFEKLENHEYCIADDLRSVIPYEKTQEEIEREQLQEYLLGLKFQIEELKGLLSSTDYKTLKYLEGELTQEEYEQAKQKRAEWRTQIDVIQQEIDEYENGGAK